MVSFNYPTASIGLMIFLTVKKYVLKNDDVPRPLKLKIQHKL